MVDSMFLTKEYYEKIFKKNGCLDCDGLDELCSSFELLPKEYEDIFYGS